MSINLSKNSRGETINKPTCLILDEIDGVADAKEKGCVQALIDYVYEGKTLEKKKK